MNLSENDIEKDPSLLLNPNHCLVPEIFVGKKKLSL